MDIHSAILHIISRIKEIAMPRINQPVQVSGSAAAPAEVNASVQTQANGTRVVTFTLPAKKEYTPEMIDALAAKEGQVLKAYCDISGEPIFHDKNVNEVKNPLREEFNNLTMSSRVMKALLEIASK